MSQDCSYNSYVATVKLKSLCIYFNKQLLLLLSYCDADEIGWTRFNSKQSPVAESCPDGNELTHSMKGGKFR
jgi:hypothetical protein